MMNKSIGYKLDKAGDRAVATQHRPLRFSRPRKYIRYRNYVELVPTPDGEYLMEVFFNVNAKPLVDDQDEPVLPPSWHEGIYLRAKWWFYTDSGDLAQATHALNSYTLWLSDKPSEIEEETVDFDSPAEVLVRGDHLGFRSREFDDGGFDFRFGG